MEFKCGKCGATSTAEDIDAKSMETLCHNRADRRSYRSIARVFDKPRRYVCPHCGEIQYNFGKGFRRI